jgi:hypothetical protein
VQEAIIGGRGVQILNGTPLHGVQGAKMGVGGNEKEEKHDNGRATSVEADLQNHRERNKKLLLH